MMIDNNNHIFIWEICLDLNVIYVLQYCGAALLWNIFNNAIDLKKSITHE